MPDVWQVADRIHTTGSGSNAVVEPDRTTMEEAVTVMTGAKQPEALT